MVYIIYELKVFEVGYPHNWRILWFKVVLKTRVTILVELELHHIIVIQKQQNS